MKAHKLAQVLLNGPDVEVVGFNKHLGEQTSYINLRASSMYTESSQDDRGIYWPFFTDDMKDIERCDVLIITFNQKHTDQRIKRGIIR